MFMRTEIYSVRSDAQEISYINNNIRKIANAINEKAGIKILYKTEIDANAKRIKADLDESLIADNPPELYVFLNALDTKDISSFYTLFAPFIEGLEKEVRKRYESRNIKTQSYPHIQIYTIDGLDGDYPAYCFTFKRRKFLALPRITLVGAALTDYVSKAILKAKEIFAENFDKCPDGYIYSSEKPVSAKDKMVAFFTQGKQKTSNPVEDTPEKQEAPKVHEPAPSKEKAEESKEKPKAPAPAKEKKQKKNKETAPAKSPAKEKEIPSTPAEEIKDKKEKSGFKSFLKSFIPMKGDSKKNLILKIIVLLAIVVFIVGAFLLLKFYVIDPKANDNAMKDIQSIFYSDSTSETSIEEVTDSEGNVIETVVTTNKEKNRNWKGVQKINKEIVGWVQLNKTDIDYPVLYHKGDNADSQFYLYKNYKKEYSDFGSIFLDYRSKKADARHVILHGHNMGSDKDAMFGSLIRYTIKDGRTKANTDYYKSHAIINYDTPKENGEWVVFAAMKLDVSNDKKNVFNYLLGEFENDAQFMNFVYNIKERSYFDVNIPINETDRLLTLSTCSYESDNMRTIIVARKVREGEDVSKYIKGVKGKTPATTVSSDFSSEFKNIKWYDGTAKPKGDGTLEFFEQSEMFTVKFYDANGKVIRTEQVLKGKDAKGITGEPPQKKSDSKYRYRFLKWSVSYKNVQKNLDVKPVYEKFLLAPPTTESKEEIPEPTQPIVITPDPTTTTTPPVEPTTTTASVPEVSTTTPPPITEPAVITTQAPDEQSPIEEVPAA
ncbi:MAG: class B sortase [Ruminococcaceae bacterium]|nr:class B sortase [Oscillospiraceae bacterium]